MEGDPWRGVSAVGASSTSGEEMSFEDNFMTSSENSNNATVMRKKLSNRKYIPLDDSEKYLAALKKKLARLQGTVEHPYAENQSKVLLKSLAEVKEEQANYLLQRSNKDLNKKEMEFPNHPPCSRLFEFLDEAVDPKGPWGLIREKFAPIRKSLAPEELQKLVKADVLAVIHNLCYVYEASPQFNAENYKKVNLYKMRKIETDDFLEHCEDIRSLFTNDEDFTIPGS